MPVKLYSTSSVEYRPCHMDCHMDLGIKLIVTLEGYTNKKNAIITLKNNYGMKDASLSSIIDLLNDPKGFVLHTKEDSINRVSETNSLVRLFIKEKTDGLIVNVFADLIQGIYPSYAYA